MFRKVLNYLFTGILTQALVFLLWIILPNFLTTSVIGEYNISLFYVEILSAFVILGGDSVLNRFYFSNYKKEAIFSSVFYTFFFLFIVLLIISFIFLKIQFLIFLSINLNNYYLIIICTFFNSLSGLILVHYIAKRKSSVYRNLQICKTIVFFLIGLGFSYLSNSIYGLFLAYILSSGLIIIYHLKYIKFIDFRLPSKVIFIETIKYGFPLTIYTLMGVITIYSTRLVVNLFLTISLVGIFGFYNIITNQINGLWSSFNKAWTPELFSKINKNESINFVFDFVYLVMFCYLFLVFIIILAGKLFLFQLIFKIDFLIYINVFIILIFYPFFNSIYTIFYPLFYISNNTFKIMRLSIFIALFNLFVSYILIKFYSLIGASLSIVISSLFNLMLYLYFFRRSLTLPARFKLNLFMIFLTIMIGLLSVVINNNIIGLIIILFLTCFYIFCVGNLTKFFNKNFYKSLSE
jgi:O-antigen/teichoic acid export membrane protein